MGIDYDPLYAPLALLGLPLLPPAGCCQGGKHLTLMGSPMGTRADFAAVMDLVFAGKLQVAVDKTFPFEDARSAHERLESGRQLGKITLAISNH
ncbi:MAG: zinc-binding dehydrogenase [Anaerolineales bacterium]|nr:zinc-binding dehydrogenase [Anaerolineales bacterium]